MQGILLQKLPEVRGIMRQHKIKRAYAFGSVCTDSFSDESDIDFIVRLEEGLDPVEYTRHYFDAINELESLLKRSVDFVAEETMKNPYFIKVVDKTKTLIYE
jgi:uncharacterized protein